MAANIHRHPAPNPMLGELMGGWYSVPQNPMMANARGIERTPTLGEIMGGSFVVPQNPIAGYVSGMVLPIGVQPGAPGVVNGQTIGAPTTDANGMGSYGGCSGGCGCGGDSGGCSCGKGWGGGMGDISTDVSTFFSDLTSGNFSQALMTDTILGMPAIVTVGALVLAGVYFFGGTGPSRAKKSYRYVRRKVAAAAAA